MGAVALLALASCGGKVVVEDESGTGGAGLDCAAVSFDFDAPILACTEGPDRCELVGTLPDGRAVREACDGSTTECDLFVDDVLTCSCPSDRIDFATACSNGVPTCANWLVDYSDIDFCVVN
jgi:hypothetical protein